MGHVEHLQGVRELFHLVLVLSERLFQLDLEVVSASSFIDQGFLVGYEVDKLVSC